MSATFYWNNARHGHALHHGTSSDQENLRETFPEGINSGHIPMLWAMHRATGYKESLWSEIAHLIESLPEGTTIKVWVEY
jgi:hypothetical protein